MKNTWICALLLSHSASLVAQSDTLDMAEVSATALLRADARTVLDSSLLPVQSAAEYLTKDSRFLLRAYSPGSVATVGLGGAGTEQTRVLWDGIDISSMASGVMDLSLVPAVLLSSTPIMDGINGGASTPQALAGAVQLGNTPTGTAFFKTIFRADNIGGLNATAYSGGKMGKVRYTSLVGTNGSENAYPYDLAGRSGVMTGMAFRDLNFLQSYAGSLGDLDWQGDIWYTQSEKSNRGSIIGSDNVSYLADRVIRAKYKWNWPSHQIQVFGSNEWQSFTDTLGVLQLTDTNTYSQFTAQYRYRSSLGHTQLEWSTGRAGGTSRDARLHLPTVSHTYTSPKGRLKGAVRGVWFGGAMRPAGSFTYLPFDGKRWKSAVQLGSFYRIPTLNELYWQPGGNPDLQPERSTGGKLTFSRHGQWTVRFTSDQTYVTNLIQWIPQAGGNWTPENYKAVYTSATTLSARTSNKHWSGEWDLTHHYSRVLQVENSSDPSLGKQLIYRPNWQGTFTGTYSEKNWHVQMRSYLLGARHSLRDNSASGLLPLEFWTDFALTYRMPSELLQLTLGAQNITGSPRQYFQYFPLPGRTIYLSIILNSKS